MSQATEPFRVARDIPLDDIDIPSRNVRRREITAGLDNLADSIAKFGLQQPIVVMPKEDRYSVVIGQRRYLAFRHLGRESIPAFVLNETLDSTQVSLLSFSENIQRVDLSPRDKAATCSELLDSLGSVHKVASALGISQQTVRKWVGYARVPESIKQLVMPGGLTVPQATRIWTYTEDEEIAQTVAENIANEPIKENRDRVINSAKQLPGSSANAIFHRAEELQMARRIQFDLIDSEARAMDEAVQHTETDAGEIAKSATVEWLEGNKFLLS
jgi:ParB/RepB/Spo0J family partition protein